MPPELVTAIVGATIAAIVSIGASAALLPRFMEARMGIWQKQQESKLQEAADERKQLARLVDSLISDREAFSKERESFTREREAATRQNEVFVKALTTSVTVLDVMSKDLRTNTGATAQGAIELSSLKEQFGVLLKEGSAPVQQILANSGELIRGMSAVITQQRSDSDKLTSLETLVVQIGEWINSLQIAKKVGEETIKEIKSTGEIPILPA